jgi:TolA-binding protein
MRDYERGDYAASAKGLAAAARLAPASPQTHFYLGASYLLSGDTAAALTALQTTIDRGDSAYLEDARFYLAKALTRRGDLDEAPGC